LRIGPGTAEVVEIPGVLERISRKTRSEAGRDSLKSVLPASSRKEALERQDLLRYYIRHRDTRGDLPWDSGLKPVRHLLENARETALLTGDELLLFRTMIGLGLKVREAVREARFEIPGIEKISEGIRDLALELERLQVISDDGVLYDHASPDLERVRLALRESAGRARAKCLELSLSPAVASMLQDRVVHFRKGRFSLLVRIEDSGRFEGIALDRTASGKGVYMEPSEIVILNNRIEILRGDESREERKILSALTAMLLERGPHILDIEAALARLDVLHACSAIMENPEWVLPEIDDRSRFHFQDLWNPLIGKECVPIDIHCGERFRQLVITGPNTGGKTVALKSVAIAVFLALCGFPVPASEGSVVGWIDYMAADIGDEQGIEQSLSTFSSHVGRIVSMMGNAGRNSLVLLDELGAGTDPQEGAALGIAILEFFRQKGSLVLATTHHNPIKRYAVSTRGVETAGMEFDPENFSPVYRLLMGIPGKSNALLIARRLGMPDNVITSAREQLSGDNRSAEELMAELFDKQAELEKAGKSITEERKNLAAMKRTLEEKLDRISERQEKVLASADRKALSVLEEAEEAAKEMLRNLEKAAESAARREFEKSRKVVSRIRDNISGREETLAKKRSEREGLPAVGDTVRIGGTEAKGVVESLKGEQAVVAAGAMKIEVPLKDLTRVKGKITEKVRDKESTGYIAAPKGVPSSIMVRGMTVDEAIPEVETYLDRAFRAGYGEVVIIHGRGEGILRRTVHSLCSRLPYVTGYRLGNAGEGGYGVTIVSFRR
jgi:DNA mismatch repair protein MutS2